MTVPGLLFGTIGVLAPLRMDELGAGAAAIAALLPRRRRARGDRRRPVVGRFSDRRGRRVPALAGLAAGAAVMRADAVARPRPGSSAR